MLIYGAECTLTLVRTDRNTAIPYTLETIREETDTVALDPLVGYMMPLIHIPTGRNAIKVHGCVVTRVCDNSLRSIVALLDYGYRTSFILLLNRIVEKRIYRALTLSGWEVRGDRGEALYVRLDMEGKDAGDWDATTKDLPWEQKATMRFADGDIAIDGVPSANIYRFSLTRIYGDAVTTVLQLHYPLRTGDILNDARRLAGVTLTFADRFRIMLSDAVLLSFHADTCAADELLIVRRFRVDGACSLEVRNADGVWETAE